MLSVLDVLHYGGDENRVLQLATAIDRARFDFRVATLRGNDAVFDQRFGSIASEFDQAGIPVLALGGARVTLDLARNDLRRHALRAWYLARNVARLVRYIRRERIDVIDAHHGPGYLCGVAAAAICGIPSVMTTYNVREAWSPRALWFAVHQLTLAAAAAIVTDSDAVARQLRAWMMRKTNAKVHVIPNGPWPPAPHRAEAEVRRELGLPARATTTVVGHVATLVPGKGQDVLIDAAPAILARHPDTTFLIVGFERADSAGYTDALRRRAIGNGVADRVVIAPYQGHIGDIWQLIDVQAHPTMLDSLPNSILEGMALGKPLVATAFAGIPTLVRDGDTGLLVAPGDRAALGDALGRLLGDADLRGRLGREARRRYESSYMPAHLAARMEALFDALVAVRRA